MAKAIGEILQSQSVQPLNLKQILEAYEEIVLTEDEMDEAILWAKRKKKEQLHLQRIKDFQEINRKEKENLFQFDLIRSFMMKRAEELFKGKFVLDNNNENLFTLLCYYYTNNPMFEILAEKMGIKNPSLDKGILLAGNFGTGKSWLMKLFQKNARQTYYIRSAKEIAQSFLNSKEKMINQEYLEPFKNSVNDSAVFNQSISGLCIDDLGAEGLKNNFGNVSNVIGDLVEYRYDKKFTGILLHGSTNLSAEELKKYYGERVTSRFREIFNWIILTGEDRRK